MITLGLTGGIGSGKSAAAGIFGALGAYIVDADRIARGILKKDSPAYRETVQRFGDKILSSDGTVNRAALAEIVFGDKTELDALNGITHKYIFESMRGEIERVSGKYNMIVLDVPLLFNPDFDIEYDKSAAVIAEDEVRIKRVMARDGVTREKVIERMRNQLTNTELRARADYIIENNSDDIAGLENKIKKLYERLINII